MTLPLPVDVLGKIPFELQYGTNQPDSEFLTITAAEIAAGASEDPYFVVDPLGGVRLQAELDAATSPGSSYPRSELREVNADGTLASWDAAVGIHWMLVEGVWEHIPGGKPNLVGAQIHGPSSDKLEVVTDATGVLARVNGTSKNKPKLAATVKDGDTYQIFILVASGVCSLFYNDLTKPKLTFKIGTKGNYFKAGAYVNDTVAAGGAKEFGAVRITKLVVGHNVPAPNAPAPPVLPPVTPPVVVPVTPPVTIPEPPVTAQTVVMIIRHGEKPDDDNNHNLDQQGYLRANALADVFAVAPLRAGLSHPDRLYASEGTTKSRRPVETLTPTAARLGGGGTAMPIVTKYAADDGDKAGKEVAKLTGVTLMCWEHDNIPSIVKALGGTVTPKIPKAWPDDRFDEIWVFTKTAKGWSFVQVPELIPGMVPADSDTPIK